MRLDSVLREYRAAYVHNPEQFYPNSFEVQDEGNRVVLVGRVKRHIKKGYRIVAILKPKRD